MNGFDLPAYRARIGLSGAPTLEALHVAHTSSIPFENLDIHLGRPIRLDLTSLQAKLVTGGRGGYCFEHNSLFAAALRTLGFEVRLREARVRRGGGLLGRTHLVLEVEGAWLADVGFGGDGILGPVPLDGREQERYGSTHRIVAEGLRQVLQVREGDVWSDLYALEPSEVFPIDLVIANHYTSTHPDSKFTQLLTAQWCAPGRRTFLRDLSLKVEGEPDRELEPGDLMGVLADRFGLRFPPGTRFNPPGAAPAAGRCP